MYDTSKIQGAVVEHWIDKALREGRSINYSTNLIRMSAETLLELNKLKNSLRGTDHSLYEAAVITEDRGEVF